MINIIKSLVTKKDNQQLKNIFWIKDRFLNIFILLFKMVSKKLRNLLLISILIFVVHLLEEIYADFYKVDNFSQLVFLNMVGPQAGMLAISIMFILLLRILKEPLELERLLFLLL